MDLAKWLTTTRADSVMTRQMMTLRPQDPLSKAATRLIEEQVSGAPVVDDAGACVGVLSVTDLIVAPEKAAAERQKVA
jgi:predicted transcriptional regulator